MFGVIRLKFAVVSIDFRSVVGQVVEIDHVLRAIRRIDDRVEILEPVVARRVVIAERHGCARRFLGVGEIGRRVTAGCRFACVAG
ncbi:MULTISPECIES: hypothetical protein [Paraburkholderia]|uniref:hypothetical protein n=1 Tax=Paraburkholderia TaxID=1822464 RepID=UPI0038BD075D